MVQKGRGLVLWLSYKNGFKKLCFVKKKHSIQLQNYVFKTIPGFRCAI